MKTTKEKPIPRMVEVSHDKEHWLRYELIADITRFETQEPYIARADNGKNKFLMGSFPHMREIEEPSQKEETFDTAWARTCERIVKGVIDAMPDETFKFEFSEGKVKITKVK